MGIIEINEEALMHQSEAAHRGIQSRKNKLNDLNKAFESLVSNSNLTGKAAQNMNAYIKEIHVNGILKALKTLIQAYDDTTGNYASGYLQVDSNPKAHLLKEELVDHRHQLKQFKGQFSKVHDEVSRIVTSVSDICIPDSYQEFSGRMKKVEDNVSDMENVAHHLMSKWQAYEEKSYYEQVASLLPEIERAISQNEGKNVSVVSDYVSGSFANLNSEMIRIMGQMKQTHSQDSKNFVKAWQKIKSSEQAIEDANNESRKKAGWDNLRKDIFFFLAGAAITIATGGAGAPLVLALVVSSLPSAVDMISDVRQGFTGDTENLGVEALESIGLNSANASAAWEITSIVAGASGSGAAYSKLVEHGVVHGALSEVKPIFKTAVKNSALSEKSVLPEIKSVIQNNASELASNVLPHFYKINSYTMQQLVLQYGKATAESAANQVANEMVVSPTLDMLFGQDTENEKTASKAFSLTTLSREFMHPLFVGHAIIDPTW